MNFIGRMTSKEQAIYSNDISEWKKLYSEYPVHSRFINKSIEIHGIESHIYVRYQLEKIRKRIDNVASISDMLVNDNKNQRSIRKSIERKIYKINPNNSRSGKIGGIAGTNY